MKLISLLLILACISPLSACAENYADSDELELDQVAADSASHPLLYNPAVHNQQFRCSSSRTLDECVAAALPTHGMTLEQFYAKNPEWVPLKGTTGLGMKVGLGGNL